MTFRIDLERTDDLLKNIDALFQRTYQEPMKWAFVDEKLGMHYADERSTRNQLAFFSVLAVGITCLGLLGMISNKVIEKTKEIGIRKVLGARDGSNRSVAFEYNSETGGYCEFGRHTIGLLPGATIPDEILRTA